jgi:GT2 family glycosyltransferase
MRVKKDSYPFVSILVLNWNGKRFVDSFFKAVARQTYPQNRIEIIFIDNDSSDDSVDYFLSKHISNARLLETGDNYGYAGGNNYGFREAKGDYVVVCNNDQEMTPTWLEKLVQAAAETDADVVVPKVVFADTDIIDNAGCTLVPNSDWPNREFGKGSSVDDPKFNKRTEITSFTGTSPLYKRSFLRDVGFYDKRFFLYWEDNDLAWRGQNKGKKYIYTPEAVTYHRTSSSTGGEQSPIFIYYVSRNRLLILLKHSGLKLIAKGFAKVGRDHVLYKIRDLYRAMGRGSGRKQAARALWLGIRIMAGACRLAPIMLAKRYGILKEETL